MAMGKFNMRKLTITEGIIIGIILLLIVKYVLVGLKNWNSFFHPTRIEDKDSLFMQPLLGIFNQK
jgi:hypothetical protein